MGTRHGTFEAASAVVTTPEDDELGQREVWFSDS
jgi:hypothetical protein